jgi:prepilin-type N-terminal cleavage/methylation domain-containing protein
MRTAFTLIELLVVVTIIVVLLALLTPALDKAIYQAELAGCAATLKGIGQAAVTYTGDSRRWYPARLMGGTQNYITWGTPSLRTLLKSYLSINDSLQCPLTRPVDLENSKPDTVYVRSSYNLWFGFQYVGYKGMLRYGDRLQYIDGNYNALATDLDCLDDAAAARAIWASHPDDDRVLVNVSPQDSGVPRVTQTTYSWWQIPQPGGAVKRGRIDTHCARDDGSVDRYDKVTWDEALRSDGRMVKLPFNGDSRNPTLWSVQPAR